MKFASMLTDFRFVKRFDTYIRMKEPFQELRRSTTCQNTFFFAIFNSKPLKWDNTEGRFHMNQDIFQVQIKTLFLT